MYIGTCATVCGCVYTHSRNSLVVVVVYVCSSSPYILSMQLHLDALLYTCLDTQSCKFKTRSLTIPFIMNCADDLLYKFQKLTSTISAKTPSGKQAVMYLEDDTNDFLKGY